MLIISHFLSLIKKLGSSFFIWSMPLVVIALNILKDRELFEINVFIAFFAGIVINFLWEYINSIIDKKEYHKNLL